MKHRKRPDKGGAKLLLLGNKAGVMDELTVTQLMWIFSVTVVAIFVGLLWPVLSGDIHDLLNVLQNLF